MSSHTKKPNLADGASGMDTAKALQLLDEVIAALALPTPPSLTAKQKKAATRSRKGMEKIIPTIANLSNEHGVTVPKRPTSEMTANLALVSQLEPVKQKLVSAVSLVEDNMGTAGSASWNTASTLYGMLQKVAHRDSQLKSQLAPVVDYFAYRTPAAKQAHPKQKGKKQKLAQEKTAAAQATTVASSAATATTPAPPASANAAPAVSASVAAPRTP
jgi:hypothetical protein